MLLFIYADSVTCDDQCPSAAGFATGEATAVLGATLLDIDRQRGPLVNSVAPLTRHGHWRHGLRPAGGVCPRALAIDVTGCCSPCLRCRRLYVWRLPESVSPAGRSLGFIAPDPARTRYKRAQPFVAGIAAQYCYLRARRFSRFIGAFAGAHRRRLDSLEHDWWGHRRGLNVHRCAH